MGTFVESVAGMNFEPLKLELSDFLMDLIMLSLDNRYTVISFLNVLIGVLIVGRIKIFMCYEVAEFKHT